MERLRAVSTAIDRLSDGIGRGVSWLTLAMVVIGGYNAVVRYLGRFVGLGLSSNAYIELQWYLFSLVFLLGGAWALRRNAHVRVDVLYGRFGPRGRAWINLLGTILFLMPFSIFALVVSWPSVRNSWRVWETSPDPGGLPRYPIKAMILVGFGLLLVQAVSEALKQIEKKWGENQRDQEPQPNQETEEWHT